MTFANSLDPDQAQRNVRPDLDPNSLTLWLFLLVWFDSLSPSQQSFIMSGAVFLGWTRTKQGHICLAQAHNSVTPVSALLWWYSWKNFPKKLILKKISQWQNSMKHYPGGKEWKKPVQLASKAWGLKFGRGRRHRWGRCGIHRTINFLHTWSEFTLFLPIWENSFSHICPCKIGCQLM